MENLLNKIMQSTSISTDLHQDLIKSFERVEVAKNTTLLSEGQWCKSFYFIDTGYVRTYYYSKGKDITSWIYKPHDFFTSWYSFYKSDKSFEYIETVADCVLYKIGETEYVTFLKKYQEFSSFARSLSEHQLAIVDLYFKGYMQMTAKEKYAQLLKFFPDVELHLKLGHIATYLGISQETLSRLRSAQV